MSQQKLIEIITCREKMANLAQIPNLISSKLFGEIL